MALEVPTRYLALAPVIITAPTTRCGTTLAQRLLSASSNAFVYGEEVGHHIRTLTNFLIGIIQQLDRTGAATDADFERALAGALREWRPGLLPPVQVMLRAWVETYYQIPTALADYGRSIGRPIWGFKGPDYSRDTLKAFLMLMPQARVVYLFRSAEDALRSAKARRFVTDEAGAAVFCAQWTANIRAALELREDPRVLFLRYEGLIADPAASIDMLQRFTGVADIRTDPLATKVNTFAGAEPGFSPSGYVAPAELTAAERVALEAHAGPLMRELYPTASPPGFNRSHRSPNAD